MKKGLYILLILGAFLLASCNKYSVNCATYEGRKKSGLYTNKKSDTYNYKK